MRGSTRPLAPCAHLILEAIAAVPGGRQADLATASGLRQQIISKLLYGDTPVTPDIAIAIHRATGGQVPASALRPDLWASPEHVPPAPVAQLADGEACLSPASSPSALSLQSAS